MAKLLQILVNHFNEWPEACKMGITQDGSRMLNRVFASNPYLCDDEDSITWSHKCCDYGVLGASGFVTTRELAEDHATAVVTKEQWEAAKFGTKTEEQGWIRWRGRKTPPLADDIQVRVRLRDGENMEGEVDDFIWDHEGDCGDIMAYQVIQPVVVEETKSTSEMGELNGRPDIREQRDRFMQKGQEVKEHEAAIEALRKEQQEIVEFLKSEGFALLGSGLAESRVAEPAVELPTYEWKVGDLVEVLNNEGDDNLVEGKLYPLLVVDNRDATLPAEIEGGTWLWASNMRWHSRP